MLPGGFVPVQYFVRIVLWHPATRVLILQHLRTDFVFPAPPTDRCRRRQPIPWFQFEFHLHMANSKYHWVDSLVVFAT